jgi:hypothetical protein
MHHLQAVTSDANTSSSLPIGWIRTEFLTRTSNVGIHIESHGILYNAFQIWKPSAPNLLRPAGPLSAWLFFSFGATAPIWALAYLHETLRY